MYLVRRPDIGQALSQDGTRAGTPWVYSNESNKTNHGDLDLKDVLANKLLLVPSSLRSSVLWWSYHESQQLRQQHEQLKESMRKLRREESMERRRKREEIGPGEKPGKESVEDGCDVLSREEGGGSEKGGGGEKNSEGKVSRRGEDERVGHVGSTWKYESRQGEVTKLQTTKAEKSKMVLKPLKIKTRKVLPHLKNFALRRMRRRS